MLRNRFGVTEVEFLGLERLADSLAEGHGIVVAPNHSHPADPFIAAGLGLRVGRPVHLMATRHIFEESALQRFLLTRVGNFSVSREGTDFRAIRCAENIIVEARHPLVMFPEGIVTRSNDRLIPFQRGVSLIARRAAARRAREGGRVVVHPMFIRYTHQGNVEAAAAPVLADRPVPERAAHAPFDQWVARQVSGWGGCQRSSPSGGCANGMPRKA